MAVGGGTALFVCGTCFSPAARIRSLDLVVDGERQPVSAHGMPRLDFLHEQGDAHAYRSGFWGLARIGPRAAGTTAVIGVHAGLEDGGEAVAELARIEVASASAPVAMPGADGDAGRPLVAIGMATYNPPADLLARQLGSIRAQTHAHWVCVISDDCSSPDRFATLQAAVADDPRFVVSRSPRRLGFYRNFERALSLAPAGADLVALADQDDAWDPDKLATLVAALGDAQLAYSDARIVARDGALISETYWRDRRNNHDDLLSLLVANAVTGAASLFPRDLLDDALPFPPAQFAHFHDHWLALVALARGDIAFVDRPLYDYVQHGSASLGHATANRMTALRDRLGALRRDPRERVRRWRTSYFGDACRLLQFGTVLEMRCGDRMTAPKRRALERFLAADTSPVSLATLGARGARELLGGRTETLGAEWMLFHAFAWRRLLAASARERPARRLRLDAVPPPDLVMKPNRGALDGAGGALTVAEKIAPLDLAVSEEAPRRVNLLIPSIDLDHFFGGYIAAFNLARRLAERGARVRIVTVDPSPPLPRSWRRRVEAFSGLAGVLDRVEVAFGRETAGLEVSPTDRFVATTWWTAHIAHAAIRGLGGERFLYLIQEHEPFTFPMGTWAALADESYTFPHVALFSTELLRDWFRRRELGVFADPDGDASSASFQNAITAVAPPTAGELAARSTRRLLFYARPEPHAARNMFDLGVLALSRAVEDGAFASGWELHGIGTVEAGRRIGLGGGTTLELVPRAGQEAYAEVLRRHDVGLALMYTPHPSLVPIEMASAGMLTVTNRFENKTAEAMAAISSNLLAVEPTIDGVAAGLRAAAAGVEDVERRARGSAVRWSREWDRSFDGALLDRVDALLEACGP
ncbi:MAG: hypothetical protein JWN32_4229 [Solirubrobacterales bacterium]|nr:hypothetical protein [Solirubrobacterales bacterium]